MSKFQFDIKAKISATNYNNIESFHEPCWTRWQVFDDFVEFSCLAPFVGALRFQVVFDTSVVFG